MDTMSIETEFIKYQNRNWNEFQTWLQRNSALIAAADGKTATFYAGVGRAGEFLRNGTHLKKIRAGKVEAAFEEVRKINRIVSNFGGEAPLQTLEIVLKGIKKTPKLFDVNPKTVGKQLSPGNLYKYMELLCDRKETRILPKYISQNKPWGLMSVAFAKNAKGEIKIIDGVMKDTKKELDRSKILVRKELLVLLHSDKLDAKSKKRVEQLVAKYEKEFDQFKAGVTKIESAVSKYGSKHVK